MMIMFVGGLLIPVTLITFFYMRIWFVVRSEMFISTAPPSTSTWKKSVSSSMKRTSKHSAKNSIALELTNLKDRRRSLLKKLIY